MYCPFSPLPAHVLVLYRAECSFGVPRLFVGFHLRFLRARALLALSVKKQSRQGNVRIIGKDLRVRKGFRRYRIYMRECLVMYLVLVVRESNFERARSCKLMSSTCPLIEHASNVVSMLLVGPVREGTRRCRTRE